MLAEEHEEMYETLRETLRIPWGWFTRTITESPELSAPDIRALYDAEFDAPLRPLQFVGLSASYVNRAWLVKGSLSTDHFVIFEEDDLSYYILRSTTNEEDEGNPDVAAFPGPFPTPYDAIRWFRAR